MAYAVKEIFKTLQGEGAQAGSAAVFCRFTGCNLWTGREEDRHKAICQFCDTDFVGMDGEGGGRFASAAALLDAIEAAWGAGQDHRLIVFTGGEPLLQLDVLVIAEAHARGFRCAVETNGTLAAPVGTLAAPVGTPVAPFNTLAAPVALDWICVSPKAGAELVQRSGHELKLVFPQPTLMPDSVAHLDFANFFLQPMDGPERVANTAAAVQYCMDHPQWRLSVQTHKVIGIP